MAFDYSAPDVSAETIAAITAEMSGSGLPPLSDEEREQRQIEHWRFLEQCRERDEEQRAAYRAKLAEAEALAKREATIAAAQAREKMQTETRERLA
jgi:hypothetical protein